MIPIHTSVMAAFRDSLRSNAGTPFEMASTPVSATAPDEKPRINRNNPSVPTVSAPICKFRFASAICCGVRFFVTSANEIVENECIPKRPNSCASPHPTRPVSTKMYRYVGNAKMRPDSLMPRRFASVMSTIAPRHSSTRWLVSACNAGIDVIARTPAQIDTATVRM